MILLGQKEHAGGEGHLPSSVNWEYSSSNGGCSWTCSSANVTSSTRSHKANKQRMIKTVQQTYAKAYNKLLNLTLMQRRSRERENR